MKYIYILFTVIGVSGTVFSQDGENNNFNSYYIDPFVNQTPQTPNAANFTIYGNIPVNTSSGLPTISIPIYTIEEDGVTVPISISYHASGVRVDEYSSSVGMKWTLIAGGGIYRTVNDVDDFVTGGGWTKAGNQSHFDNWLDNMNNPNQAWYDDSDNQPLVDNHVKYFDQWPDNFSYNFLNYSGSFVFKPNGEILKDETNSLNIEFDDLNDPNLFYSMFTVTDQSGNQYSFSGDFTHKEFTTSYSKFHDYYDQYISNYEMRDSHFTGWLLDGIATKNNKQILFEYGNSNGPDYIFEQIINPISQRINILRSCDECEDGKTDAWDCEKDLPPTYLQHFVKGTESKNIYGNSLIKKITTENVTIEFLYETGAINGTIAVSGWDKRLDKIIIKDSITGKQKRFEFKYDIFEGENNYNRLKLIEIQEFGFDNNAMPPYKFTYFEDYTLPEPGSKAKDMKGYFNGKDNTSLLPRTAFTVKYHFEQPHNREYYFNLLADKNYDLDYLKTGTLKSIEYPTGGKTEFEYEVNAHGSNTFEPEIEKFDIDLNTNLPVSSHDPYYYWFYDIRYLDQISTFFEFNVTSTFCPFCDEYDEDDNPLFDYRLPKVEVYKYNGTGQSLNPTLIGEIVGEDNLHGRTGYFSAQPGDNQLYVVVLKIHKQTYDLNNPDFMNVHLEWYQKSRDENDNVEYQKHYFGGLRIKKVLDKNTDDNVVNVTKYTYNDFFIDETSVLQPDRYFRPLNNILPEAPIYFTSDLVPLSDWVPTVEGYVYTEVEIEQIGPENNGKIIEEYVPKKSFNSLKGGEMLQKTIINGSNETTMVTEYFYTHNDVVEQFQFRIPSMQKYPILYSDMCNPLVGYSKVLSGYGEDTPLLNYKKYKNRLDSIKTTEFFKRGSSYYPITTIKNYEYNNDLLVTKEVIDTRYTGTIVNDEMVYTLTNDDGEVIGVEYSYPKDYLPELQTLVDNFLVSLPISKEVENNALKVLGQYFVYDNYGNINKTFHYNKGQGSNTYGSYVPSDYEEINSYEFLNGKPIQVQTKGGSPVSYIWGYNNTYPVAKLEGVAYSGIPSGLINDIKTASDAGNESSLNTALNALRGYYYSSLSVMITTYTYSPLVGVTSITDPKGDKITYHYDGFGRLDHIKDADGNKLEEYDYHYRED